MKTKNQKSSGRVVALGLGLSVMLSAQSQAQYNGDIRPLVGAIGLGSLTVAGNGCPSGSVQADLSESGDRLVLRFTEFFAAAGGVKTIDRKACLLALPLHLPRGLRVRPMAFSLNGFASLPGRASGRVSIESFFAGKSGSKVTKTLPAGFENVFRVSTPLSNRAWSACGDSVNLRANLSVLIQNRNSHEMAFVAVTEQRGKESSYVVDLEFSTCTD